MRAWKVALAKPGPCMDRAGFNELEFSPDHSDELGLWPKGVLPPPAGGGGIRPVFQAEA